MDSEEGAVVAFDCVQNAEAKPVTTQLSWLKFKVLQKTLMGKRSVGRRGRKQEEREAGR